MIKEYILEMFSGSCCHVPECLDSFVNDDDFAFCGECSVKDFLLSCSRSAMIIDENNSKSDSAIH